jgi:hypothetical protein
LASAAPLNFLQAIYVAANTKAAKAFELPVTIEHRQTRHYDRQTHDGIIERPKQAEPAEGCPRCERCRDLGLWIKIQGLGNLNPRAVKYRGSFRSEQFANS